MSILAKPYDIYVYDDILKDGSFKEVCLGTIGSDKMLGPNRALEPNLVRNINGQKNFSFKMYKKYVDPITGKRVLNPFTDWLINERKVKVRIEEADGVEWHDFIIKDVKENSSNYLYTYELEDAIVQELSKNGFGKTLDAQLNNNIGTAKKLAESVLAETDWTVESEALVQKVEEPLVYVKLPENLADTNIFRIKDQTDMSAGVDPVKLSESELESLNGKTVLAFYSSCTSKPNRFQFIYVDGGYIDKDGKPSVSRDENRVINVKDCQYYIDIDIPEDGYVKVENTVYYLPQKWSLDIQDKNDATLSYLYRGARYGFAIQAEYVPLLDRYCNKYTKDGQDYYGYSEAKRIDPTVVQEIVNNPTFEGTTGWVGTYYAKKEAADGLQRNDFATEVESMYVRMDGGTMRSALTDLYENIYSETDYFPILRVAFKKPTDEYESILINTGFYDKRTTIEQVTYGEEWILDVEVISADYSPLDPFKFFDFKLREVKYNSDKDLYELSKIWAEFDEKNKVFKFNDSNKKEGEYADVGISAEGFRKKEIKLVIKRKTEDISPCYFKKISLYKKYLNKENEVIAPGVIETEGVVTNINRFFPAKLVKGEQTVKSAKEITYDEVLKMDYGTYVPVYNSGAEKTRAVSVRESNYFNILQSIAETFEAWPLFVIGRNETTGAIEEKKVFYQNYSGGNNYAAIRYGVNLKDISRSYSSKDIVTKLIVKQNSNQYGKNGFCTIARSDENLTGENYIYDFRYYYDNLLLNADEYYKDVYVTEEAIGQDIDLSTDLENCNSKGYYPRIKSLNNNGVNIQESINILEQELINLEAEKTLFENQLKSTETSLEELQEEFYSVAGYQLSDLTSGLKNITEGQNQKIDDLLIQFITFTKSADEAEKHLSGWVDPDNTEHEGLISAVNTRAEALKQKKLEYEEIRKQKEALNKAFFNKYSRFIQEGTWISEEYTDDNKYYADAQSVMYDSCRPQAAYVINILELSSLPGYELFKYKLGEKTYVEDPEFFGTDSRQEVIISEISERLDNPNLNTIKVQNFKNQFQDLFQRITATVQQAQYSTGAYEKAAALAEADAKHKGEFLEEALNSAYGQLTLAGQTSVHQGVDGITLTDETTQNQLRLIGGAILMSVYDEHTGQKKWKTGLTPEGISASLITAGTVNTGNIEIKNGSDRTFLWNSFGISAFDFKKDEKDNITSKPDEYKFVRFDRFGIYGIDNDPSNDNTAVSGENWKPNSVNDIAEKATFALTWEGLKVVGNEGAKIRIGKSADALLKITKIVKDEENKEKEDNVFSVDNDGNVEVKGVLYASGGNIGGWNISQQKVDENYHGSLIYGTLGEDNSFHMYGNEFGVIGKISDKEITGTLSDKNPGWKLTIGSNFGVTANGNIYCNSGKFGNFSLDTYGLYAGTGTNSVRINYDQIVLGPTNRFSTSTDAQIEIYSLRLPDTGNAEASKLCGGNIRLANRFDYNFDSSKIEEEEKYYNHSSLLIQDYLYDKDKLGYFTLFDNDYTDFKIEEGVTPPKRNPLPYTKVGSGEIRLGVSDPYMEGLTYETVLNKSGITYTELTESEMFGPLTCGWGLTFSSKDSTGLELYTTSNYPLSIGSEKSSHTGQRLIGNWIVTGTFTQDTPSTISSDKNKKNSISLLSDQYSTLFDNLRPCTFKYNEGTSGRTHTGFIAQEVKEAMNIAGITNKEFAALCIDSPETESETWSLRYSEFISLNTWQIQLLKVRVEALENEIKNLKSV